MVSGKAATTLARLFVLVACGLPVASAWAQSEAVGLLRSMTGALRTLDYQGSFVYEHNGGIDALRIFHEGGKNERERLTSLNGPRSEVMREEDLITCTQADGTVAVFPNHSDSRLLPLVPRRLALSTMYEASTGGEDRVAGYRARIVDILPQDGYRYGYRLWLETGSSLPLRVAMMDSGRRVLEQFMFVSIDIHVRPNAGDLLASTSAGSARVPDEVALTTPPRWRIADPPPGFSYVAGYRPALAPTQSEHYVYGDGIANVSVYVEPADSHQVTAPDATMSRGALNVYSHSDGEWRITVLGDVPRATVQRMARSLQPAAQAPAVR